MSVWKQALTKIPRNISKEDWRKLSVFTKWLVVTRAAVLIITLLSSSIAGILAYRNGLFDFPIWLLVTVGLLLCHATNNILNDYVDWTMGVDQTNYYRNQYGPHPLSLMSKKELLVYLVCTGLSALCVGLYLCYVRGETVVYLTLSGAFFLLFYTWPLKYIALGEISVFIVWGVLMIGGGYYTITNRWDWHVVLFSCPYALSCTTIIFGKHIDKLQADRAKRIRTLPVLLGERLAPLAVIGMIVAQYAFAIYLVYTGAFSRWLLISVLALVDDLRKKVFTVFSSPRPASAPAGFPPNVWPLYFSAFAFVHNRSFGSLFLLGLILDTVLGQ
eukprot:TRINITY_DN6732_c0_g1_i1.p1 TRINITY_DN6732_c0_g1~~TRINITY_DN6732_c0_g1_i1.p1  ORF type:complete len:330 (-),score=58.89 TRINITY_DN6732_c0_g1_i1:41-1030(-)